MTTAELIQELQKYPPDLPVIGYRYGKYADKVFLSDFKVKIEDGRLEYFGESIDAPEVAVNCVMIEFDK